MIKKLSIFALLAICAFSGYAQKGIVMKVGQEKMLERFLSYVKIESQSVYESSMTSFPMTEGQKEIARLVYNEVKGFGGKGVKVTLSDDFYVYIDIPSNVKKDVPSLLLMAHLDVTPEAPGTGIKPIVHRNYDGGNLELPGGITLSPDDPRCSHLKGLEGKTIVTSDGTTLLGADDKTGCAVLVSMVEEIINNPKFKHGRVMVCLSQNEDVGKAALRYDPSVFGDKPDAVVDIDSSNPYGFSIGNFTAIGHTYYFKGNAAHPARAKKEKYGDALTAAAYFIGQIPPDMNPSASEGKQGYIHCYQMEHPVNEDGKIIETDYIVSLRLRYFDKEDGANQKQLLHNNLIKVQQAFPFVEATKVSDIMQYENVAYGMPDYLPILIQNAGRKVGKELTPQHNRTGSTSGMILARYPNDVPGGCDLYSGQNGIHSRYEWCCIEELLDIVTFTEHLLSEFVNLK